MTKTNLFLLVISVCFVTIFGTYATEQATEKRMLREQARMIEKLREAQKIELDRIRKQNEAFEEALEIYKRENGGG